MKFELFALVFLAVMAALFAPRLCASFSHANLRGLAGPQVTFANIAEKEHVNSITKKVDAAIATKHLLVKQGTDANHVAVCGAADLPIGPVPDEAEAAEDPVEVQLLGAINQTVLMVASEAITANEDVYTAASGKVQDEPASAGTYYKVGTARSAAGTDGDVIEVQPCLPIKLVVLAALGNADAEIGGLSFSSTVTQAEGEALAAKCEELADDVRAIAGALATPALVKVLSA